MGTVTCPWEHKGQIFLRHPSLGITPAREQHFRAKSVFRRNIWKITVFLLPLQPNQEEYEEIDFITVDDLGGDDGVGAEFVDLWGSYLYDEGESDSREV